MGQSLCVPSVMNRMKLLKECLSPRRHQKKHWRRSLRFFDQHLDGLKAIGIGSFGPIEVRQNSSKYGQILSTPKLAWKNFDFLAAMKAR